MDRKQISFILVALGLWLLAAPSTFAFTDLAMIMNDHILGALLVAGGLLSSFFFARWYVALFLAFGLWLNFAPLLFWALEPIAFLNDTLVGLLVLTLAFRFPGMQGRQEEPAGDAPAGWSFNPSGWAPRTCTIFLAMICWFLSRYLSAYQLGYINDVWDPFFGSQTIKVLTSKVADFFPVSDAGLGAFGYSLEAFLGWQGNTQRWRTMPWLVIIFGLLVVPAGLISISLIVLQPIAVGAWCGLCLLIAACMLVMIVLTISEVVATLGFLAETKKSSKSFWDVFWKGAAAGGVSRPVPSKSWGISIPWNLALTALLGVWIMCSPAFFKIAGTVSDSDYTAGPLLITVSIVSFAEVARGFRLFNVLLGLWLLLAPWILSGATAPFTWNNSLVGLAVILLSFRKGNISQRYGSFDKHIF